MQRPSTTDEPEGKGAEGGGWKTGGGGEETTNAGEGEVGREHGGILLGGWTMQNGKLNVRRNAGRRPPRKKGGDKYKSEAFK